MSSVFPCSLSWMLKNEKGLKELKIFFLFFETRIVKGDKSLYEQGIGEVKFFKKNTVWLEHPLFIIDWEKDFSS
ncbi:hypothetical protein E9993_03195 [Labilibacter sediminis]|nr:hypothetical protein E9993_03195 [Labilibacter sediminis]